MVAENFQGGWEPKAEEEKGETVMQTWTPLWSGIVDSSVWGESKDVKILWITMLAKKDRNGMVELSDPGLARASVLTREEFKAAIHVLESPDPYSSTQEHEGRRVQRVPGGWIVLNHEKYRNRIATDRRAYQREKQREYRVKRKLLKLEAGKSVPPVLESEGREFDREAKAARRERELQEALVEKVDLEAEELLARRDRERDGEEFQKEQETWFTKNGGNGEAEGGL